MSYESKDQKINSSDYSHAYLKTRELYIRYLWGALMGDFDAIIVCIGQFIRKNRETEVSTPTEQERQNQGKEKLDQELAESLVEPDPSLKHLFFESCFTSDSSPGIEKREILSEIAANRGVSIDKVKNEFPTLRRKLHEIVKISRLITKQKKILQTSSNLRKNKKALKKLVSLGTKRLEVVIEITDNLWDYLLISGKNWLEELAFSFVFLKIDDKIEEIQKKFQNSGKPTDLDKLFLSLLAADSRFLKSISEKAIGRGLREKDLNDQNIDETDYAFASERDADRLNRAIERSKLGITKPMTLDELYQKLGASEEEKKRP
jgi:hypothetical protein